MGKRNLFIFYLLASAFLLISPRAQAVDPIRNFQIDVISIQTSLGVENVTEQNSREIIEKINAGFNEMSPGAIRFTFRKLYPTIVSKSLLTTSLQVGTITGLTPKPDLGYEDAILIGVVSKNPLNGFAGMAGGKYMLMNGGWSLSNALTVTHELGHNMGLLHANSATCTSQLPIVCDQYEYGDYSSFMGNYINGYVSQPYVARLSATELDKLKILPTNKRVLAVESGTYNLSPVYSPSSALPKVLYIPIANQYAYSVEYRPPIGNDISLGLTRINSLTDNWYYTNTPSHGLQLRILKTDTKEYPLLLPKLNNFELFETALVSDSLTGPQVQPIGKSFTLSDGSTVTFVSQDPVAGAVVKIVRPADTEAPKFLGVIGGWEPTLMWFSPNGDRLIRKKSQTTWDYPIIEFPISGILDNRLVKKVALEVNGKIVQEVNLLNEFKENSLKYQTFDEGKFNLRLIATDYQGNLGTSGVTTLASVYTKLPIPGVVANQGKDPFTSLKFSFYKIGTDVTYSLTELSSGKIESEEEVNGITTFTVIDIARNSKFSAKLTGSNTEGYSDDGQIITGTPRWYEIKPPSVQASSGDDPYTMLKLKFYNACETCKYSISNLNTGKVKSIEVTNGVTTIVIEDIKRNQRMKATLTGNDSFGFTDGGQEILADTYYYEIRPPLVSYSYGEDPRTSLVIVFRDACKACTYSINDLEGGVLSKTEKIDDQNFFTISNIPRNSQFKATLIGRDVYGFNDSGQMITKSVEESFCDNSVCYQGMDWVVNTGYWTSGTGNMSLQELVKGKWVTVKTAKPIATKNNLPKYPNTFAITIKNVAIGKRTYRLSISAKGKYSAYVGKSFTQVVNP